jgi:L-alanine-DL-glutamate epimerase-like enolase superfamily enzyme
MLKIRRFGSFKPWGAAVSAIEMALWDIAGKAANLPVYMLLGGKIRDRVRCYNGGVRFPRNGSTLKDYEEWGASIRESKEGFTIVKQGFGFHTNEARPPATPGYYLGNTNESVSPVNAILPYRGPLTEKGLNYLVEQVAALKHGLGEGIDLALDGGPGFLLPDAIKLAKALEPFNLIFLEDLLTGNYYPYVMADDYLTLTNSTTTPIHTGEQIYLRQNFRELIEKNAVRVIGPDPADVGGIAEMKWIADYADLHSILIAPHGIINGLIGLAAQVMVGAAMPENYIAFEYPVASPSWWYDIIDGLPDPIVKGGQVDVWDRPGLGVEFNVKAAKQFLLDEDKKFFD